MTGKMRLNLWAWHAIQPHCKVRETERKRERQADRQANRQAETERQRHTDRETERQRERDTHRDRQTGRQTDRQRDIERARHVVRPDRPHRVVLGRRRAKQLASVWVGGVEGPEG
jgi:hypothetical protein